MQDFTAPIEPYPEDVRSDADSACAISTVIGRRRVAVRVERSLPTEITYDRPQGSFLSWNSRSQENRGLFKIAHLSESSTPPILLL
jgi:hypothetical protein